MKSLLDFVRTKKSATIGLILSLLASIFLLVFGFSLSGFSFFPDFSSLQAGENEIGGSFGYVLLSILLTWTIGAKDLSGAIYLGNGILSCYLVISLSLELFQLKSRSYLDKANLFLFAAIYLGRYSFLGKEIFLTPSFSRF